MLNEYNKIFIIESDVYSLGGPEVFNHLQHQKTKKKNLIVISSDQKKELGELSRKNDFGADDILEELISKKGIYDSKQGYLFYDSFYDGLDVVVTNNSFLDSKTKFALEDKVLNLWAKNSSKDSFVTYVTNNKEIQLDLQSYGKIIERPKFLLHGAEAILKRGILEGSEEFSAKLFSSKKRSLSLEESLAYFDEGLFLNEFVKLGGGSSKKYARVTGDLVKNKSNKIVEVTNKRVDLLSEREYNRKLFIKNYPIGNLFGISPLDMEQFIAVQYGILDNDITTAFITGSQGSGKTLLAYLGAMSQVLHWDKEIAKKMGIPDNKRSRFDGLILLKPTNLMGTQGEIGFLPGSMYQKLKPHLMPYIDAHGESELRLAFPFDHLLLDPKFPNDFGDVRPAATNQKYLKGARLNPDKEVFEMTYSAFIRGRSFTNKLLLIDEAQNFTPYEVKTIFERMGPGSKIIVMGDPLQTDNVHCSREINGLTHAVKHYLDKPYSMLVNLTRNYRSQMSDDSRSWKTYASLD